MTILCNTAEETEREPERANKQIKLENELIIRESTEEGKSKVFTFDGF